MIVNCLLNFFALSMLVMAVLVPKRMLLFCCVGSFLLNSFAMAPQNKVRIMFVITLSRCSFQVFFVFMYLFVYVIVKSNYLWV